LNWSLTSRSPIAIDHNIAAYFRDCTKTFADYVTLALDRQRFQRANLQTQNENDGRSTARAVSP